MDQRHRCDPRGHPRPPRGRSALGQPLVRAAKLWPPELDAGEADHGLLVNVPLLVTQNLALGAGNGLQEGIDGRIAAPAQLIAAGPDQLEKSLAVRRADAGQALQVGAANADQAALFSARGRPVAIATSDMSQVDAENPEELAGMLLGELAEDLEKAPHPLVCLGPSSGDKALGQGPAQDGHDLDRVAQPMLEEDALELDGVLDRMAVILERYGIAAVADQSPNRSGSP
jgi:hypothetical protein